jgi:hypothetical protein
MVPYMAVVMVVNSDPDMAVDTVLAMALINFAPDTIPLADETNTTIASEVIPLRSNVFCDSYFTGIWPRLEPGHHCLITL